MSCWHGNHEDACDLCDEKDDAFNRGYEAGMTEARQTWVGLTTKEIREWWASENGLEDCGMAKVDDFEQVVRAIEAKLKEKNHD